MIRKFVEIDNILSPTVERFIVGRYLGNRTESVEPKISEQPYGALRRKAFKKINLNFI